jgi:hyperosmotically inducible periplasmic protein
MKAGNAWLGTLAVATLALVTYGCENTGKAKEETREAAQATENAAERAGDKAATAAGEAGDAVHGAKQTFDVKAALTADTSIDASHIDVDTNGDTKTVTLKGTVPTAAQKAAAERVARDKAEGYTIVNQLTVAVQ